MKRIFFTNLLFFLFFLAPPTAFATGPSYVWSGMNPVSINDKGEILCRTRFLTNDTGGHWYQRFEYGLCVISNGKIVEFITKILDPEIIDEDTDRPKGKVTGEEYWELTKHWDWIYKTGLDFQKLSKQQKRICEQYGFKENNAEKFKVDKKIKIKDFEKEKNISLTENKQLALKTVKSVSYDNRSVHILYDFGNIIIFNNTYNEDPQTDTGASFSYVNPLFGGIEYEYYKITGALFLSN